MELREQLQVTLGGAYVLDRELGGGAMSRVFLAREVAFQRDVVVKVLPAEMAAGVSLDRFRREIQMAGGMQHPHIVPVLSTGSVDGMPYFTMPFVAGESLRALLARDGPPPLAYALRVLREVADALAYAHDKGLVHRDVKPENILIADNHALVTDFGVAKALRIAGRSESTLTGLGMALGTPSYMAPEQATADPAVDHRADIYALGVVAYELLSGSPPFAGRSPQAVIAAHIAEMPKALSQRGVTVPVPLEALVMRMLAKEQIDRPQSARDVERELERIAGSLVVDEQAAQSATAAMAPPGRRQPGIARRRSRPRALAGGIAVTAIGLALVALLVWRRGRGATVDAALAADESVAVLPFANMSGSAADDYFSDGMTEEVSNAVARVGGLRVAARSSAFAYKGRNADAVEIAQRLRVRHLIEGTVRRSGSRVRITAELINGSDGIRQWGESYERDVRDVFAIQDEIALAIARALELRMIASDAAPARGRPPTAEAHDLYLRGRFFWQQRDAAALRQAISFYDRALHLDSSYALAYAGRADAYSMMAAFGNTPPDSVMPKARADAKRALMLDSTLAEAQTSLAIVTRFYDRDWNAAERLFTHALALNPDYASARLFYGFYLLLAGHDSAAVAEIRRARDLEPLSPILNTRAASVLDYERRYAEADSELKKVMALDPDFMEARIELMEVRWEQGRVAEALAAVQPSGKTPENDLRVSAARGYVLARMGRAREAHALLDTLLQARKREYIPGEDIAYIYAGLGDPDSAFAWLNRAVDEHSFILAWTPRDPLIDPLRSDPRWPAFVARLGSPH